MAMTIFAATQTGDLVETADVVTGVANVKPGFAAGMFNEIMSAYTGGKTFTTGAGKLAGVVAQSYIQGIAINAISSKLGKDPYAWMK